MLGTLLAAVVPTGVAVVGGPRATPSAHADETTVSDDVARTGWDQSEAGLSPAIVGSSTFGQVFSTQLDGQVYAQPVIADGTLVAATENDQVYGMNPSTGAVIWHQNLGPSWPASTVSCGDLLPNIGVTSTPVYDSATHAVYVTAKVNNGVDVQHPNWYMHAFDVTTGAERAGFPVPITGSPNNDPTNVFDPEKEQQRPGLLLMGGVVYAGFGAHCDVGPYRGYVVGVSTARAAITSMWATEAGASSSGAGIWDSGDGLVSDGSGRILFATGNGVSPAPGPGTSPPSTLAESVVRLQVNATTGQLSAADFFAPSDANTLDQNDTDFGSGGPVALPASFGSGTPHPHLLVQAGKDGRVYLLDRDALGGRGQGPGGGDAAVETLGPYQGQWGHPGVWGGDGGYVYEIGSSGPLRALSYGVTGTGNPSLTLAGTTTTTFGYTTGSPVVTSTGTTSGSALVWFEQSSGPTGDGGTLVAYNPVPDATGILHQVFAAPIGTASKFAVPATDNNHVYVGTRDGNLIGFGSPATTALTGSPVTFASTPVGSTSTQNAVLTATSTVTVTALSAAAPFTPTAPALPVTLAAGSKLTVPVTFAPTTPGTATGTLSVTTGTGTVGFSLIGSATQPGLHATPSAVTFPDEPTGFTTTANVQITNTGTAGETVTAASAPGAPFTVTGLPATGTTIAAGGNVVVSVTYAPTLAGNNSGAITITSTSGKLTVPVTANAITGTAKLVLTPATTDFGSVPIGGSSALSFDLTNTGNLPVTVTKAKAPASEFTSPAPLAEGLIIQPGAVIHQSVTFTPTSAGTASDVYEISANDGQGAQYEILTGTGVAAGTGVNVPAPNIATWSVNGSATLSNGTLALTDAANPEQAGTAFYRTPVAGFGIHATYTATFPADGGDGSTFAILDATKNTPTAVGVAGGGVGFSGLTGIGVVLGTYWTSGASSNNYVAIVTGPGTGLDSLTYLAVAPVPSALRAGTHAVTVDAASGHLTVAVDGTALLDRLTSLPPNVLLGFTAGDGATPGLQTISNVAITAGGSGTVTTGQPLTPAPTAIAFGTQTVGSSTTQNLTLTNDGTVTETISAAAAPAAPFTAALPATGATVAPGATVTVPVTYRPTDAATSTSAVSVTSTSGTVTVALSGTGTAAPAVPLSATPTTLSFGQTATGTTATQTITFTNTAGTAQTIVATTAPAAPFKATLPTAGTSVAAGASVTVPVTFAPTATGPTSSSLTVTTAAGATSVTLTGSGTAPGTVFTVPAPNASTWSVNGIATLNATTLALTSTTPVSAGTAFYRTAIPTSNLKATWTAAFPATGGDGSVFALLDPAKNTPAAVGATGGGLGFSGLTGVGVALGTYWTSGAASNNYVAIVNGTGTGTGTESLSYAAVATVPTPLRGTSHTVTATVTAGHLTVAVDGTQLLSQTVTLTPTALVGFTAGNGSTPGAQSISAPTITTTTAGVTATPATVAFGARAVSSVTTIADTITNTATSPVSVVSTTAPAAPFTATLPTAGTTLAGGASTTVPVTFKPTTSGTFTSSLIVTTTGGSVTVPVTGTAATGTTRTLPAFSDPSWSHNGTAAITNPTATLTVDGSTYAAGSVINSAAVNPLGLHATFTANISGAGTTGADGLTFALLDAPANTSTALGASGSGLGLAGRQATYVSLQTYPAGTVSSPNFLAVGTTSTSSADPAPIATTTAIPTLRGTSHLIDVTVTAASHIVVKVDGTQVLDKAVTLPTKVLAGFTAGTGSLTDTHTVASPTITYNAS